MTKYEYQERTDRVDGYTDSDWAGCRRTAKSTSGGLIRIGSHYVKSWSTTRNP